MGMDYNLLTMSCHTDEMLMHPEPPGGRVQPVDDGMLGLTHSALAPSRGLNTWMLPPPTIGFQVAPYYHLLLSDSLACGREGLSQSCLRLALHPPRLAWSVPVTGCH